jgi:hypothetical protein
LSLRSQRRKKTTPTTPSGDNDNDDNNNDNGGSDMVPITTSSHLPNALQLMSSGARCRFTTIKLGQPI